MRAYPSPCWFLYGADVAAETVGAKILPFDSMIRGIGFGMPSIILPIVAFFISRKEPSKALGSLITVAGVLVIIGGIVIAAMPAEGAERDLTGEIAMSFGIGALITVLGAIKLRS